MQLEDLPVPYYHGLISRQRAEEILHGRPVGSFLLRKRSEESFAISVVYLNASILHYMVDKSKHDNMYSISNGSGHQTPSLLCQHYMSERGGLKTKLLYPVVQDVDLVQFSSDKSTSTSSYSYKEQDWYHGQISRDEDSRQLSKLYELERQNGLYLVRSKDDGTLVLSLVFQAKVHRYKIFQDHTAPVPQFSFGDKGPKFDSIENLLEYLKVNSPNVTGVQCQLTIPCCRHKIRKTSLKEDGGIAQSSNNKSLALASQLKSLLPANVLEENWSNFNSLSTLSNNQVIGTSQKKFSFNRFNRLSLPKDSIGYYSPYCNWKAGTEHSSFVPCDLFISQERLKVKEQLGKGHFGRVCMGECDILGRKIPCAVKILCGSDVTANKEELLKEAAVMQSLDHPHIVRLLAVCKPETDGNDLKIVLELAPLGSVKDFLKVHNQNTFPEVSILGLMKQVCDGMAYLSYRSIVHRDLAARNLLLVSERYVKISDFGMSRILQDSETYYRASKPGSWPLRWYPPEALLYYKFTTKGDVWSFGITLWEALSYGSRPYEGMKGNQILQMLELGRRLECPQSCSPGVYSLLLQCWSKDMEKRPTFNQLLRHFEDFVLEV